VVSSFVHIVENRLFQPQREAVGATGGAKKSRAERTVPWDAAADVLSRYYKRRKPTGRGSDSFPGRSLPVRGHIRPRSVLRSRADSSRRHQVLVARRQIIWPFLVIQHGCEECGFGLMRSSNAGVDAAVQFPQT
jgi:hypothetical protein